MKKLKLEALEVTSFETSAVRVDGRGTVNAHAKPATRNCPPATYNVDACGYTNYFDCTYGCSLNTNCVDGCIEM